MAISKPARDAILIGVLGAAVLFFLGERGGALVLGGAALGYATLDTLGRRRKDQ